MNEAITDIFDRHNRQQKRTGASAVETILTALADDDRAVVLDWLGRPPQEFSHAAAARALVDLAATLPATYNGPTQFAGGSVSNWRERH